MRLDPQHRLLGLCGYAGSGKDFVYEHLKARTLTGTVERVALADEVRYEVEAVLGGGNYLTAVWSKPYPYEVRRLLQWWGTDLRRAQDENYWVDKSTATIEDISHDFEGDALLIVVTDVRFGNEAEMIRDLGGMVVQVTASDETRAERLGGKVAPAHASEVIDFEVDAFVQNDSDGAPPAIAPAVEAYLAP